MNIIQKFQQQLILKPKQNILTLLKRSSIKTTENQDFTIVKTNKSCKDSQHENLNKNINIFFENLKEWMKSSTLDRNQFLKIFFCEILKKVLQKEEYDNIFEFATYLQQRLNETFKSKKLSSTNISTCSSQNSLTNQDKVAQSCEKINYIAKLEQIHNNEFTQKGSLKQRNQFNSFLTRNNSNPFGHSLLTLKQKKLPLNLGIKQKIDKNKQNQQLIIHKIQINNKQKGSDFMKLSKQKYDIVAKRNKTLYHRFSQFKATQQQKVPQQKTNIDHFLKPMNLNENKQSKTQFSDLISQLKRKKVEADKIYECNKFLQEKVDKLQKVIEKIKIEEIQKSKINLQHQQVEHQKVYITKQSLSRQNQVLSNQQQQSPIIPSAIKQAIKVLFLMIYRSQEICQNYILSNYYNLSEIESLIEEVIQYEQFVQNKQESASKQDDSIKNKTIENKKRKFIFHLLSSPQQTLSKVNKLKEESMRISKELINKKTKFSEIINLLRV